MALEDEAEDCGYSPCNACRADNPGGPFECRGVEDATVHQQDGNFDHEDCEAISDQGGGESLNAVSVDAGHWTETGAVYLQEGFDLGQLEGGNVPAATPDGDHETTSRQHSV